MSTSLAAVELHTSDLPSEPQSAIAAGSAIIPSTRAALEHRSPLEYHMRTPHDPCGASIGRDYVCPQRELSPTACHVSVPHAVTSCDADARCVGVVVAGSIGTLKAEFDWDFARLVDPSRAAQCEAAVLSFRAFIRANPRGKCLKALKTFPCTQLSRPRGRAYCVLQGPADGTPMHGGTLPWC